VPCCLELSSHGLGLARRLRARARTSILFVIRQSYRNVRRLGLGTQICHLQQQLEGGQAWVEGNGESGRQRGKSTERARDTPLLTLSTWANYNQPRTHHTYFPLSLCKYVLHHNRNPSPNDS
jgi:hypothetical protein